MRSSSAWLSHWGSGRLPTPLDWLGAIGIIAAAAFAAAWLTVALGMAAKTPESAGLAVVPLILLPFVSSAIVRAAKMGAGVRQFAEYQPFTPIIDSVRGLLAGTPSGGYAAAALAWCAAIALVGYLWSRATFSKRASASASSRQPACAPLRRLGDAFRRGDAAPACCDPGHIRLRPVRHPRTLAPARAAARPARTVRRAAPRSAIPTSTRAIRVRAPPPMPPGMPRRGAPGPRRGCSAR